MRGIIRVLKITFLCSAIVMVFSCEDEINIPEGAFDEHIVDISGTWRVQSVRQNGIEITDRLDFSTLALHLDQDGAGPTTYQVESAGAPFIILDDGMWSFNDNVYPTSMTFLSGQLERTVVFTSPPVSGGTSLSISMVLGCSDNIYVYQFAKQ